MSTLKPIILKTQSHTLNFPSADKDNQFYRQTSLSNITLNNHLGMYDSLHYIQIFDAKSSQ